MFATALVLASLTAYTPPIQGEEQQSHCVCDYHEAGVTKTKYSRTFAKVITSGFWTVGEH